MTTTALIITIGAILAVAGCAFVLLRQGHAEETSRHRDRLEPEDGRMVRAPGDRPGGPGQGGQHVVEPGEIAPGDPDAR